MLLLWWQLGRRREIKDKCKREGKGREEKEEEIKRNILSQSMRSAPSMNGQNKRNSVRFQIKPLVIAHSLRNVRPLK